MKRFSALKMACIVFVFCAATVIALPAQTLTALHSFAGTDGLFPYAGLVQASDGNFYGTTYNGGTYSSSCSGYGCGTVFRITPAGTLTTLYSFSGTDGSGPESTLVQATDGNLYGTTFNGGANNSGTVFKISLAGALTTLHSFTGTDGAFPEAGLVQATDGNFYGTTAYGASGDGTVFKITPAGTLTTLHSFGGTDGSTPFAGLVQATDKNLYGATLGGGAYNDGTVFRITLAGALTTLHSFDGTDGSDPWAALVQATDGNLYGTTYEGGAYSYGTVFRITLAGTLTTLHSFDKTDGSYPYAGLVQATDGNLYGATFVGGTYSDGAIFKITTGGTLTTLQSFAGSNGSGPEAAALVQGTDGNLYGTTDGGGTYGNGTVFQLAVGLQPLTTLHTFIGTDGSSLAGGLVQATDGNLYGTTGSGGAYSDGTAFRISSAGTLATLYNFCSAGSPCPDGADPGGVVQATDGNFYGATSLGGAAYGDGTIFKITPAGTLTTLYSFCAQTNCPDGNEPSGLVQGTDGNLYGTTYEGGAYSSSCNGYGCGTVFKITPAGTLTTLHSFAGSDGSNPGGLIQATDGNFYGATLTGGAYGYGTIFKITPAGALTTLHSFCAQTGCPDGYSPSGELVQASDGNFYGTTLQGGAYTVAYVDDGTVFKITPAGTLTTLHSFAGTDGSYPAGLVQANDGNFYGTTEGAGGSSNCGLVGCGTVFRITPAGTLTTLHSFAGTDGRLPEMLVQATDGNLYGTTYHGGNLSLCEDLGCGTVFKLAVGMGPFVEAQTTSGIVGAAVIILGTNLTGATKVRFNGTSATFTVVSSSEITTTVPAGATTGVMTVATPSGTLKSNVRFRVTPQIKTFTPGSGAVGTVVTITGVSLTQTKTVSFGGVKATSFTVNSDTQVTATVPTGAKTGHIAITTPGGTGKSSGTFRVT